MDAPAGSASTDPATFRGSMLQKRYRAFPLNGIADRLLRPPTTQTVHVMGVDSGTLRSTLRRFASESGFQVTDDAEPYVDMFASHGLHTIHGGFMAERNLRTDRSVTRRRDRKRWTVIGIGLPIAALGWYVVLFGPPHTNLYLLGVLATMAGMLLAAFAGMTFANVNHESDVIGVRFTAQMPASDSPLPMLQQPGTYLLRVTTGHAMSQDWEGQGGVGRQVISIEDQPELADLRAKLVAVLNQMTPLPDHNPLPA
jgi:hypothetical protein